MKNKLYRQPTRCNKSRYCCVLLVIYIMYIYDARSRKYQIMKYICWLNI